MRGIEELINNINFKKAVKLYILLSILLLVISGAVLGYTLRDNLKTALDYKKASEAFRHYGNNSTFQAELTKLPSDSQDIINCVVVDRNNNIIYKTNDKFINGSDKFILTTEDTNKKYLHDNINKDVVYKATPEENLILNRDFFKNHEQVVSDIDENLYFEKDLQNQNIHLLNYVVNRDSKDKLFIIRTVPIMPYAETIIKAIGMIIGLIFIVYWVGIALWVYKDANRRRANPALWGGIVLITNVVGVIVYIMYKQTNKVCYKCGALQSKDNIFCGSCGAQINERCEKCNNIVGKHQHYCSNCGHRILKNQE